MNKPKLSILMAHNEYQTGSPYGENALVRVVTDRGNP
jgi:hypothetical protein